MPKLPTNNDRIVILGHTGSGKTVAAIYHLSMIYGDLPWIIIDYKHDASIAKLFPKEIDRVPQTKSGLFTYRPLPGDDEEVEDFLWNVWKREKIGLMVDEGYLIKNSDAFNAILMQGRSKKIPCIICSQRPVFLPRAVWSEANFFQVYNLTDKRDIDTVQNFVPVKPWPELEPFHSIYHDVRARRASLMAPVPPEAISRDNLLDKTGRIRLI